MKAKHTKDNLVKFSVTDEKTKKGGHRRRRVGRHTSTLGIKKNNGNETSKLSANGSRKVFTDCIDNISSTK